MIAAFFRRLREWFRPTPKPKPNEGNFSFSVNPPTVTPQTPVIPTDEPVPVEEGGAPSKPRKQTTRKPTKRKPTKKTTPPKKNTTPPGDPVPFEK